MMEKEKGGSGRMAELHAEHTVARAVGSEGLEKYASGAEMTSAGQRAATATYTQLSRDARLRAGRDRSDQRTSRSDSIVIQQSGRVALSR